MPLTIDALKNGKNNAKVKNALLTLENSYKRAIERFMIEGTEVDPRTGDAMRDLYVATHWLAEHIGKEMTEFEEEDFEEYSRVFLNAGHILNESVAGDTLRDYMATEGEEATKFGQALQTIQDEWGVDFSKEAGPFSDPDHYPFYSYRAKMSSTQWKETAGIYMGISRLMDAAGRDIEFKDTNEEKEYYEMSAALQYLSDGMGIPREIRDKEGNVAATVLIDSDEKALALVNPKNLNQFLAKQFGNSQKSVYQLMRAKRKATNDSIIKRAISDDPREEVNYLKKLHTRQGGLSDRETKSGIEWIKEIKENEEIMVYDPENPSAGESPNVRSLNVMCKVLAVRTLANAVPHSTKELERKQISREELEDLAKEMRQEPVFLNYLNSRVISAYQLVGMAESKSSHFGDLEILVKEALRKEPPGKLPNLPVYRHFMPTARERIEALQKIAKNGDTKTKIAAAAEIVMIRNLVHAHRDKKTSLDKPIPVSAVHSLQHGVNELIRDKNFQTLVMHTPAIQQIGVGHGGRLVDTLRKYAETLNRSPNKKEHLNPITNAMLKRNTIGGHMEQLKFRAATIRKQLDRELEENYIHRDQEKIQELTAQGEKLRFEYFLCSQEMNRVVKGKKLGPDANMPWMDVNKRMEEYTNDRRSQIIRDSWDGVSMRDELDRLSKVSAEEYFNGAKAENGKKPVTNLIHDTAGAVKLEENNNLENSNQLIDLSI